MSFTLLRGHTTFETALEIPDYPYGGYRTSIRYWLEKAEKGSKKDQYRMVSCTLNPKTGRWNKPHPGIYSDFAVLFKDERNGHIHHWGVSFLVGLEQFALFIGTGLVAQLNEEEKHTFSLLQAASRKFSPNSWKEWEEKVGWVKAAVQAHATYDVATLEKILSPTGEQYVYVRTLEAILAQLKAENLQEYTCPKLD